LRQSYNVAGLQGTLGSKDFLCRFGSVEKTKLMINRNLWPGCALIALFVLALGLSPQLRAQQAGQATPPATTQTQSATSEIQPVTSQTQPATPQTKSAKDPGNGKDQTTSAPQHLENDRIFFALPNYLTVEKASHLPPLTTGQKFKAVAEGCFDPVEAGFIGIQASIGQMDNTNPTYGQGLIGYSKRYGTAYADAIIGNFGTGAIFPALLRQDPRYYQMGKGKFLHRFFYAAARVLVTRSETSGKNQFNFSEFLGNGMAAGLSNTYHPGPHTIISSSDVLGTQILLDSIGYELKEFWPDIHRLLKHGNNKT
jgi:hypothetical protein